MFPRLASRIANLGKDALSKMRLHAAQKTGVANRLGVPSWSLVQKQFGDCSMEHANNRNSSVDQARRFRNPFEVMDVPNPNDREVLEFAAGAKLSGTSDDENANAWMPPSGFNQSSGFNQYGSIEGNWSCRWNGGADPTIPGDAATKWKPGQAEARAVDDRVYLIFDWDGGARRGLIDARREGATRLVGKYINLTDPKITRPWIGLIVGNQRIDGRWSGGRLDFRR
jgi:hypothetical protein